MAGAVDPKIFKEALIVLAATAVVAPVFHRLKVSPLVGFILVGAAVGPYGFGALAAQAPWLSAVTITDTEAIAPVAELGVVFLLFMIGLELSFERLKMMRRLVFGLGPTQLFGCAAVIALAAWLLGLSPVAAAVLGVALGVSSTALIVQTLAEAKKTAAPVGRASFAVLLFQDLAVVPILLVVSMLGANAASIAGGESGGAALGHIGVGLLQAIAGIAAIVVAGRLLLRPLFRQVARAGSPELFMAACLLVILGAGLAAAAAGVSMALGALVAGVLLAETEYRRQIEALIEPFKGLLLAVFLIGVGMGVDLAGVARNFWTVAAGAVGLLVVKAAVTALGARAFGLPWPVALRSALILAPASEFSFVILGAAAVYGLVPAEASSYALTLAALTMALVPVLWQVSERLERRQTRTIDPALLPPETSTAATVLIAGYGRVGEVVARLCDAHAIAYAAYDTDADVVARARRAGKPVYFGDVSKPDLLASALEGVRAVVVTMDSPRAVGDVVAAARARRADLVIVARARDARDAGRLYRLGATDAVPDTVEASLQLAETVLVDVGVPMGHAIASIHDVRAEMRNSIQKHAPPTISPPRPQRRLRDALSAAKDDDPA
ncbi:MAG: cation:proton antiporter [Alphaproteobacteria bacterium]|nr:cation:proton antiporter [Alphaproteobacteria bacterium]